MVKVFLKKAENSRIAIKKIKFNRKEIEKYFSDRSDAVSFLNNLGKWGEILDLARKCRNACNYEGLIIAHEQRHVMVTSSLERLADVFQRLCKKILQLLVHLFKQFVEKSSRKNEWYCYLNWDNETNGLKYIKNSLRSKLDLLKVLLNNEDCRENAIIEEIDLWLELLRETCCTDFTLAKKVWENIRIGIFVSKESLMKTFEEQIRKIEEHIESL